MAKAQDGYVQWYTLTEDDHMVWFAMYNGDAARAAFMDDEKGIRPAMWISSSALK